MILAEKIMNLRKKSGWSQEELAARLNVSRQSVSKWESSMSVPELDKILLLSQIFEVSTDYLLKDENTEEDYAPVSQANAPALRRVSMEEARNFIRLQQYAAPRIAVGVVLCILSPTILLFLLGIAESGLYGLSEEWASGIGIITLLLIVAAAVAIFIIFGSPLDKYDYLEKENFDLEYGVSGMAKEALEAETPACTVKITCGVVLCILGAVPLLAASLITDNDLVLMGCLDLLLLMIAAAVYLFITASMRKEAYEKLLQEGEFTEKNKKLNRTIGKVAVIYWPIVLAIYLWWSFHGFANLKWDALMNSSSLHTLAASSPWAVTWVIWPVAGVGFAAVAGICRLLQKD